MRDTETANDIVQEVFLKLAEQHQKSVEIHNIKAWIFQVTRNVMNDHFRKQQKNHQFVQDFGGELELAEEEFENVNTDSLVSMMNELPKKYSIPLYLSDIEQMPQKEIAEQLNLGLSATKMRIQRGREKLHNLFIQCCDIEYDSMGNFITCSLKNSCNIPGMNDRK